VRGKLDGQSSVTPECAGASRNAWHKTSSSSADTNKTLKRRVPSGEANGEFQNRRISMSMNRCAAGEANLRYIYHLIHCRVRNN
jgi:hypothetical protein